MQQNRKRSFEQAPSQARPAPRRHSNAPPAIVDTDTLGTMSDDELVTRHRTIDEDRLKVIGMGADPRPWEDELAYSRREMQIRRSRREAHDKYVRQLEREYQDAEANLPSADLDNTNFLRAIGVMN